MVAVLLWALSILLDIPIVVIISRINIPEYPFNIIYSAVSSVMIISAFLGGIHGVYRKNQ